ncbi:MULTISPECIES: aromatase/cyclase [Actinomycetes]|uniref:Aromatase/cyclase n=1 Tax=Streptomyces tendae TaxID=1932 RepID=A0ABW7SEL2_STRTE|nr:MULTISPECIES: aromatase/cyclase [unclassified Streptomyces]BET45154.1 SRPBCC family protein [Kitasatospora aureofaciens]
MVQSSAATTHVAEHAVNVAAPAADVYDLVADAQRWPDVFGPTVHTEVLEETEQHQVLRIWAFANGRVRDWTSRRSLDPSARTVTFRQVVSAPPVASMGGVWRIGETADGCRVTLLHDYRAIGDDPEALRLIETALDTNSTAELGALKTTAERLAQSAQLRFGFSTHRDIDGSPREVFDFLARAESWPSRLPHVARLDLREEEPGVQHMTMDTYGPDGSVHTTSSVRLCFPERGLIVYKQTAPPPVMTGHTGRWLVESVLDDSGAPVVRATSWHTVVLDPDGVRRVLGPSTRLAEARAMVRRSLDANSSATLLRAKQFVE